MFTLYLFFIQYTPAVRIYLYSVLCWNCELDSCSRQTLVVSSLLWERGSRAACLQVHNGALISSRLRVYKEDTV